MQLSPGGDVHPQPFLRNDAHHRLAHECLRRIDRAVAEGRSGLAAPGAQVGNVVDEQRRPEALGQLQRVAATDQQLAGAADARGVWQEMSGQ